MPRIVGYHHLSLSVTDLDRSTAWYREALGLDVVAEVEGAGFRRRRLRDRGNGVTLTLTRHDDQPGEAFDERRTGMDHVSFQLAGPDDVEALEHHLGELGVHRSEVKRMSSGAVMITFRDPDNIQLEAFGAEA